MVISSSKQPVAPIQELRVPEDAHLSDVLPTLIRIRLQVKPATLLMSIDLFLCGGLVLGHPVLNWLLFLS